MGGIGSGIARGLATTFRTLFRRSHTQQYPQVTPELPPRSRGVIALSQENCTVCMLCARECPVWCIFIDGHKETYQPSDAVRPRQRNALDRFDIDYSLCMYCGICVDVCPFDALFWAPEFSYVEGDIRNLIHDKDRLEGWLDDVPPKPALDPNGEETVAARRKVASTDSSTKADGEAP